MPRILTSWVALTTFCAMLVGCQPSETSNEVKYLQAAEEVRAEEAKLAEVKREVDQKRKELDLDMDIFEAECQLISSKAQTEAAIKSINITSAQESEALHASILEDTKRKLEAVNAKSKVQIKQLTNAVVEAEDRWKRQQEVVAAAKARRDALSPTTQE